MRVILITLVLLVGCGLLIENGSSAKQARQANRRVSISNQGTLVELFDADGKSLVGKVVGDGFKLTYRTQGRPRSASATTRETSRLLISRESLTFHDNTGKAVVKTTDGALEITSSYTFDHSTGELTIERRFQNISEVPVTLRQVQNYIDRRLASEGQINVSVPGAAMPEDRIRAVLAHGNNSDCGTSKCVPKPVCLCPLGCPDPGPNPEPYEAKACFYPIGKIVMLKWSDQIMLDPRQRQLPGGQASMLIRVSTRSLTSSSSIKSQPLSPQPSGGDLLGGYRDVLRQDPDSVLAGPDRNHLVRFIQSGKWRPRNAN